MAYRIGLILALGIVLLFGIREMAYVTPEKLSPEPVVESYQPPLGLPPIPWPKDNAYSPQKAELGRLLYFDKRLSADQTISCASCHNMRCGYSDCRTLAVGIEGAKGTRHSPTIINAAYSKLLFWDGRAASLEEQCKGPIANPHEMANEKNVHAAHMRCETQVRNIPGYRKLFSDVFGHTEITIEDIAKAIATFERTVLSGNSPYDRYQAGGAKRSLLTKEEFHGQQIFFMSGCADCHSAPNFSDDKFYNIGIGMDLPNPDTGRFAITNQASDWGAFKVPTLREVTHTGPYMHDGSIKTLEEVIEYYDKGGNPNKNLHPLIHPLYLTASDKLDLIAFLKTLNGEGWQHFQEPAQFPQ